MWENILLKEEWGDDPYYDGYREPTIGETISEYVYDFVKEKNTVSLQEIISFLKELGRRPARDIGPKLPHISDWEEKLRRKKFNISTKDWSFGGYVDKTQSKIKRVLLNKTNEQLARMIFRMKFLTMGDDGNFRVNR